MTPRILILLLLLATNSLYAQKEGQARIDSLLAELPKAKDDTNKAKLACALSHEYATVDPAEGIRFGVQAVHLSETLKWQPGLARAYNELGTNYWLKSEYPSAFQYYFKALKVYDQIKNKKGIATVWGNLAILYHEKGKLNEALEYYTKAMKGFEQIGSEKEIARNAGNIGTLYHDLNDNTRALEYYYKALAINERLGIKKEIAINFLNIGTAYAVAGNYDKAIEYALKCLKTSEELKDKNTMAGSMACIGEYYLAIVSDNAQIMKYGSKLVPKGKAAILARSIWYLNNSVAIFRNINSKNAIEVYDYLSTVYELAGNYKQASAAYRQSVALKDSIFSKENTETIAKLEAQSEYEKKSLADSLSFAQARKLTMLKLQRQKNFTYAGAIAVLVLLAFSYSIYKERKKSDRLLLNILPSEIANELKQKGSSEARYFDDVTILFTDFVNFTGASEKMDSRALINELNTCFKKFDDIIGKHNIEKIKTIGDAYLAVCGLPAPDESHAEKVVRAACEIRDYMLHRRKEVGDKTFEIRIGVHSGSVVAGIVGVKKFAYDIWGDTVNTAARMEQSSLPGKVNISQSTYELVSDKFYCKYRGEIDAKNKGMMKMYFAEKMPVEEAVAG
jgi:adenylate cyclase